MNSCVASVPKKIYRRSGQEHAGAQAIGPSMWYSATLSFHNLHVLNVRVQVQLKPSFDAWIVTRGNGPIFPWSQSYLRCNNTTNGIVVRP